MAEGKSIKIWDWPVRLFNWALVVVIAVAFFSSEEDSALNQWHVLAGWAAGVLVVFRIVWGFVGESIAGSPISCAHRALPTTSPQLRMATKSRRSNTIRSAESPCYFSLRSPR